MGVFETIISQGIMHSRIPAKTQEARNWYRLMTRTTGAVVRAGGPEAGRIDYGKINTNKLTNDYAHRGVMNIVPGQMYMYHYDPKHKDTLPYYDRFPVIFPFRVEKDRFWGINLHYLDLRHRAILMDALYDLRNNNRYDETTKLKMSYQILKGASQYRYFAPCVKNYLFSHTKSKFILINPAEWDIAAFLPTESFSKKTKAQVWAESRKAM